MKGYTTHLGGLRGDDLVRSEIALVPDEELVDILAGVAVDLVQPLLDIVEAVLVGHVVDDLRSKPRIAVASRDWK